MKHLLKWHTFLSIATILAIAVHLLIKLSGVNFVLAKLLAIDISLINSPLLLIIVVGGIPLLLGIILKALHGNLGADLLAAIALVTAIYLGQLLAADLIVLMLASGQALEQYASKKASFALLALADRMPSIAHVKNADQISDINISDIKIADLVAIYPHEICPVDGVVVEGYGAMDESYLTGEPYQLSKAPGSSVLSGAVNGNNLLIIKAEKLAIDSRYAKIMKVMQDAEESQPQMRKLADKIGAIFGPLSLFFALLVWYLTGDIVKFLSILVVATPCPLLIAIPITIISAISIAARNGIIIKDPIVLEKLPLCTTAIFDKTGTLTSGKPELTNIIVVDNNFSEDGILQLVASLEQYSRHPLSLASLNQAKKKNLSLLTVDNISEKPGQGLVGNIRGQNVIITSRQKLDQKYLGESHKFPNNSGLECVVLINEKIAAWLIFRDQPMVDGQLFVSHLGPHHHFNKIMLVSGDRESEVKYLANLFGIKNTYSSQTPEQKLAIVRSEMKLAPTLFMGDGINDAPAIMAATVGIAFGAHNVATSEAAKAVIMENSLVKVDQLIHISEDMRKIALQSAVGGMLFSFVAMIFASFGFVDPVGGALLQEIIDVVAIINSLRLVWQKNINSDIK